MNKILIGLIAWAMSLTAQAETFSIDLGHAEIGFSVKHLMVSNTKGNFTTFSGTIEYDIDTQMLLSIQGTIETDSLDTNNTKRDEHLKSEDFFNVAKFPQMTFKSTAVNKLGAGEFEVTGVLNLLGIDHEVVLPIRIAGPIADPWGNQRIGLESATVLSRHTLGLTHSPSAIIGDKVKVSIEFEATYK